MANDPVAQMVSDPDFPKLSLTDQRKALTAHDAAFGGIADDQLQKFVQAHQSPQLQIPDAMAQARAKFPKPGQGLPPGGKDLLASGEEMPPNPTNYISMSPTGIATSPMIPAKTQGEVIGAGLGGELLSGAAEGLPWFLRAIAGASGTGVGAGAGALGGGASPKEALSTANKNAVMNLPFESAFSALPWLANSMKGSAVKQYETALAPTTKANKAITQEIAPELIQRGEHGSLEGLANRAGEKVSALNPELNSAYKSAGQIQSSAGNLPGAKIAGAGDKVISDLESLKQTYRPEGITAQPQAVAAIKGVQGIIRKYGSDISPDSLRRLRQIFEEAPAKAGAYVGADLATNYTLNAQQAAADSIRGILNKNPDIGALNKEISFWLDVQRVTSQSALRRTGQEGGLLKTLWPLGAAMVGGGAGFAGGGTEVGLGAAATTMLATQAVKAARSPAWRTLDAVVKDRIANALARGDVGDLSAILTRVGLATGGTIPPNPPSGLPWQRQQQSVQPPTQ